MIPTLFGVMVVTFAITQFVPGGPVEKMIGEIEGLQRRWRGGESKLIITVSRRFRS